MRPASADCPLPETPASPVICPALSSKSTPRSPGALPRSGVQTPRSDSSGAPGCLSVGFGAVTSAPTIISASLWRSVSAVATSPTILPWRSTSTRRVIVITSPSLWEMKITDRPSATALRSVSNSAVVSCGVSTAVGSSRIRMRASRKSALRISTRWRSPTDRLPTLASGCTARPKSAESRPTRSRALRRPSPGRHIDRVPSRMFSSTVRLSASVKCWCTMPIPAPRAARGLPGGRGLPKTSTLPSSAV